MHIVYFLKIAITDSSESASSTSTEIMANSNDNQIEQNPISCNSICEQNSISSNENSNIMV